MEFWNKLSEALKQKGFSSVQNKRLQEVFGHLDAAGLLSLTEDQLLPAMTGRTAAEKRKKIETLRTVIREIEGASGSSRSDSGLRRIRMVETELGKIVSSAREKLVQAEVKSMHDLRRIARQPLDELRQFGFNEQTQKPLESYAALARVFPSEIAVALVEAGASQLSEILQWPEESFTDALYRVDLSPNKIAFEYSRLQHLQTLSQRGSDTSKLTGLDLDLSNAIELTPSERETLAGQQVQTLMDWAVMRDKVELSRSTKDRLDSCTRLYAIGVRGEFASSLVEEGITSSADVARMGNGKIEEISTKYHISTNKLAAIVSSARAQTQAVAHLIDGTLVAIPGKFPDLWKVNMLPGRTECVECADENSVFSRFAYHVYLIQRSGKDTDEIRTELAKRGVDLDEVLPPNEEALSPINGAEMRDDPESPCGQISLLDLIIRHLQEYLDTLRAQGYSIDNRQSYVYLPYADWRSERMAFYYPELNAIWRDDILTSRVIPESRGSIIFDRVRDRETLATELGRVRDALKQARIGNVSFPSTSQYQDFLRGLAVIDDVLSVDDLVQSATYQLDQDQAGVALANLRRASEELDRVSSRIFGPDTAWHIGGMSSEEYYVTLADVPPANRNADLKRAFEELMTGRKRIFEPLSPPQIAGLRNDGIIDLENTSAWAKGGGTWEETDSGFRIENSSTGSSVRTLRYKYESEISDDPVSNHVDLHNYSVHLDFEVEGGDFPPGANPTHQDFGIAIIARRQADGGGYRLSIKQRLPGHYGTSHHLVLEKLEGGVNGAVTPVGEEVDVGFSGSADFESRPILPGHVYRLSLIVDGNNVTGKLRKSASSTFEVVGQDGEFGNGAFAIAVHQNLSVAFSQFVYEGFAKKGLVPFYAKRRDTGGGQASMTLKAESYTSHLDEGHGMSAKLTELPLILPAHEETKVPLAGTGIELVFRPGSHWVNNEALDLLLEKCLAGLFFLRYAVIPVRTAQALAQRGDYSRALQHLSLLYDDTAPGKTESARRIYPVFATPPDSLSPSRTLSPDVRLLRLRIAGICLEWAEVLFRQNTNESRHQARRLYERVLALHGNASCDCDARIGEVVETVLGRSLGRGLPGRGDFPGHLPDQEEEKWVWVWNFGLDEAGVTMNKERAKEILGNRDPGNLDPVDFLEGYKAIRNEMENERIAYANEIHSNITYEQALNRGQSVMEHAELEAIAQSPMDRIFSNEYDLPSGPGNFISQNFGGKQLSRMSGSFLGYDPQKVWFYKEFSFPAFCVPPDPLRTQQIKTACLHVDLLDRCLNILGLSDSLVPPLRFEALLRLSRSFTDQAHALERDLFQIRQSFESYSLSLLEAESSVALSSEDLSVEKLNKDLAQSNIQLAVLQARQAGFIKDHYTNLIAEGISPSESAAMQMLLLSAGLQTVSIPFSFLSVISTDPFGGFGSGFSNIASVSGTLSSFFSMQASFERREQEWKFQETQGAFNELAAQSAVLKAYKHAEIAERRQQIARLKLEFATNAVQFLSHKLLNREMWIWLQRTIREQYRTRLNYAIGMSFLAERALAFEMQNKVSRIIRFDYFDRRRDGLLGATQLQTDLSTLEHTRLSFTQQKLQLTRTFSLAQLLPVEFEQFKSGTGRIAFGTGSGAIDPDEPEKAYSMQLFDQDFPGHYMRLIKSVKVTVIALIPPHEVIRASLSNNGFSRVVIGPPFGEGYKEITVQRNPESIALSSPYQANGLFNLDYRDDLLLPFEGLGVATGWIFELPKAANRFDYRTIADVLITIEYTALDSPTYRQQVIQQLDRTFNADRPFSFRHQFADAWYDLHHPDLVQDPQQPMAVTFTTLREDFPPNVLDLEIEHVTLYVARKSGVTDEIDILHLQFTERGSVDEFGGAATSVNGIVSTRQGDAVNWMELIGKSPIGSWTLAFTDDNNEQIRNLFANDQIEDILFVITFGGRTPEWPQ